MPKHCLRWKCSSNSGSSSNLDSSTIYGWTVLMLLWFLVTRPLWYSTAKEAHP